MKAERWSDWGSYHEKGDQFLRGKQRKINICSKLAPSVDHHELGEDSKPPPHTPRFTEPRRDKEHENRR